MIRPERKWFDLRLKEVWEYRDLLWLLVRRDFVSFYKQTIFGPVWIFIQPLFTTLMFILVFSRLAALSTDGLPPALFYISGITAWNYFSDCLVKTSTVFKDNSNLFGKVYFPRLIMPLSIIVSNLFRYLIQFILFLLIMMYYLLRGFDFEPTWSITLFPFLVALMAALGLGSGILISAMTTKYRDLSFLVIFGVQLFMYATTVIYPLSTAPLKYRWIIELNPMTAIIETFRYGFLGRGSFSWGSLSYSCAVALVLVLTGMIVFNKVEKDFIDTV